MLFAGDLAAAIVNLWPVLVPLLVGSATTVFLLILGLTVVPMPARRVGPQRRPVRLPLS